MKIIHGILFLIGASLCVSADENKTTAGDKAILQEICTLCHCNAKGRFINCGNANLPRLFDAIQWSVVNSSDNKVALANVEFDNNGIDVVTQFPNLDIRILSFKNNKIRKIEARAFRNLTLLERLDLSYNRLTYEALRPNVFEGKFDAHVYEPLENLKWLSLANNEIHSLDSDLFEHFPQLETLILSNNAFRVIDPHTATAISTIVQLTTLDMSRMELKNLPDYIFNAPHKLKSLNLTGNLFEKLPSAIEHAINLVEFNFDDNPVKYFGANQSVFPVLNKLETLSISDMPVLEVIGEGTFQSLPALRHFNCRNNYHLEEIHAYAFAKPGKGLEPREVWPPIQSLILFYNNLSSIDQQLIARWEDIDEIDLRFNPWKCDCENQWMVDILIPLMQEKSKAKSYLYEDLKCHHPVEMSGMTLYEISKKPMRMRCEDYYGRRPERDGPILVGIFIGLVIGIPIGLTIIAIYRRGCMGIFGYRPQVGDYGRAFYKRAGLTEDMHI